MKTKQIIGGCLACLLILSGCSSDVKKDGKSVVASTTLGEIFADDLYKSLTESVKGNSDLFAYVLDELIDNKYPVTSDMKENAKEMIDSIKSSYKSQYDEDQWEDQLTTDLAQYGYTSLDTYQQQLVYTLQYAEFLKDYVKNNFDEVYEDYYKKATPRVLSIIKVSVADMDNMTSDESAKLKEVENLFKTDKSFADIAKDYSDDDNTKEAKGSLGVVDTTSDLSSTYGDTVSKEALLLQNGKVSDAIKGDDGYYFLYCSSTDKAEIKEELKSVSVDSPLLSYDSYMVYIAFKTYDIQYEDEDIKNAIDTFLAEQLKERGE